MARASSPLSKRLKALAVRAGLPVDTGPAPQTAASAAAPPADEQPTGEFPAVAATDTPDDDRPTGEFPVVEPAAETAATEHPAPDDAAPHVDRGGLTEVPPAASDAPQDDAAAPADTADAQGTAASGALPRVPDPIWETPQVAVPPVRDETPVAPPIWTDSPPETQSPLTASAADTSASPPAEASDTAAEAAAKPTDGPTLPPPTLSKPAQLDEALALPDEPEDEPAPTAEAPISAEDAAAPEAAEQPTVAQAPVAEPEPETSALKAVDEPGESAPTPAPASSPTELASTPGPEPASTGAAGDGPALADAVDTVGAPAGGETAADQTADAAADAATASGTTAGKPSKDRLSLTGRFSALKRRVAPREDQSAAAAADAPSPGSSAEPELTAPAPEPAPATGTPDSAAPAAAPAPAVAAVVHDDAQHKPSFSERAALRRRVKTLRARRDTGLLELGAIVLDQRRFGDPTAGALLRRRTDELGDLDNEIAAIERALDDHASAAAVAALGAVRCVGCSSLVGPTDRYCAHCGTPRPVGPAAADHAP